MYLFVENFAMRTISFVFTNAIKNCKRNLHGAEITKKYLNNHSFCRKLSSTGKNVPGIPLF